jgi:HK97 family phage portal protein
MMAAALSIDAHNSGLLWNASLLENSARPSGILKFGGDPSNQTIERIRELFKKKVQGARNSGEIPMLVDGVEWQATDTNPRDMDFIATLKETSKYIASAYGVPLPLVDNDAASYNNMENAKERFYTDTVIPHLNAFLSALNIWFEKELNGATIRINMDSIPALERLRTLKFDRVIRAVDAGVMTIDEAREELGHGAYGGNAENLYVSQGKIPLDMSGFEDYSDDEKDMADQLQKSGFSDIEVKTLIENGRHEFCSHK